MSKPVKAYTMESFGHESASKTPQFMSIFDDPGKKQKAEEKPSPEEQARKIFEDAFAQGEKAGYEIGMKKVEQVLKRLNNYLTELDTFRDGLLKEAEAFSVELALAFAEALVLRECSERKDIVLAMARRAFEICEDKCDIVIRVRPEDAELLAGHGGAHIRVIPDDTVKEPGFIVETGFGDIDGRISTQIEELKKEFLNERAL